MRFQARALGGSVFFTPGEVVLALPAAEFGRTAVLRLRFSGANLAPTITGAARQPGTANYFTGADRARWRTDVPTYGAIVYHQLYDGVDLQYDGELGQLKGTYQVAASADPGRIHWRYDGAASTRVDADGSLRIMLPASAAGSARALIEAAPIAWQEIGGRRVPVDVRYALAPDGSAGFALGAYDVTQPLTIDPALRFSTYLGGSGADYGYGIAADDEGNVYVAGVTTSATFPTVNPLQPTNRGGSNAQTDLFVAKLNVGRTAYVYATYLGGTDDDGTRDTAIAVDSHGNAYVTGWTASLDFPTRNPIRGALSGANGDAFVTKINPTGSELVFSTYYGGSSYDEARGIAVDSVGNAYITGETHSQDFPTTPGTYMERYSGLWDAFVAKLTPTGQHVYATLLGSRTMSNETAFDIAVDSVGNASVTGITFATDFPVVNAIQPAVGGASDAFVSKLNTTGSALIFSTYLGGAAAESGYGVDMDGGGNTYVTGSTFSTTFPMVQALDPTYNGRGDLFVTKLTAAGSYVYSTYLGGTAEESTAGPFNDIAADGVGNAYVVGTSLSNDYPLVSPIRTSKITGATTAVVTQISPSGNAMPFSTYVGGGGEVGTSIDVPASGRIVITGYTSSTTFPTVNPLQARHGNTGGGPDAFIAEIGPSYNVNIPLVRRAP